MKILIIEDDHALSSIHKDLFASEGIECDVAENGLEALACLKKGKYQMMLLDIVMPKMNGFDFLTTVKKHKEWKSVPIVVLSNLGQETDRKFCVDAGVSEYILKTSVTPSAILQTVKKYLA